MEEIVQGIQLMGGRLCHDIAAPLSALSMGLEMLAEKNLTPAQQEVFSLVESNIAAMKTRFNLFRALVGQGQSEDQPLLKDIIKDLDLYWKGTRYTYSLDPHLLVIKGTAARLALALLLTAAEGLPRGGNLMLKVDANKSLCVNFEGPTQNFPEDIQNFLLSLTSSPVDSAPTHRAAMAWYAYQLAQKMGCALKLYAPPESAWYLEVKSIS